MRFLVDHMVGRLATWLRIAGVDALFLPEVTDDDLVRASLEERRVLLTRDNALFNRLPPELRFFVHYQHYADQIKEVVLAFPDLFRSEAIFTRCTECNELLRELPKPEKGQIPDGVREKEERFWQCPRCGKYFWRGSHFDNVVRFLDEMKNNPLNARWKF